MDIETRFNLIKRNTYEIITEKDLKNLLETTQHPRGYIGYEPSGPMHIGWLIWVYKVRDLIEAGVNFTILEATWHAYINDKLGGDLELIRKAALLIRKTMKALGIPTEKINFIDAEKLANDKDYWTLVIRVSKKNTLRRIKRALTIMGRKADEAEIDASKLIYPAMQVSDIFYLDLDIALGGIDQRKAHVLARETAGKLKRKKPVAIHTDLLMSLRGPQARMDIKSEELEIDDIKALNKATKSDPSSTIFVHESPDSIMKKMKKAYCPARVVKDNPVLEINKLILFAQPSFKLIVERPQKYGGTIIYETYGDLEKDFAEGKLHPLDLKKATAKALADLLEPVRKFLLSDREARELLERIVAGITR